MAQPTAPIMFPDPTEIKIAGVPRSKIGRRLFQTLEPQSAETLSSPQRTAAAHPPPPLAGVLSQPFGAFSSSLLTPPPTASRRARRDPLLLSPPQAAFPQWVPSAWLPKVGEAVWGGSLPAKQRFSPPRTAAGRRGRRTRDEDAEHQGHIYTGFLFAKKIRCVR